MICLGSTTFESKPQTTTKGKTKMKNKIVIITFETYLQEAHPHSLETMEYIADHYDMIEEFKIVEMSGMIVKDESEVVIQKELLARMIAAASLNYHQVGDESEYYKHDKVDFLADEEILATHILAAKKILNA